MMKPIEILLAIIFVWLVITFTITAHTNRIEVASAELAKAESAVCAYQRCATRNTAGFCTDKHGDFRRLERQLILKLQKMKSLNGMESE